VSVAAAPALECPNGGLAITDANLATQYVCDGKPGVQGLQGIQGEQGIPGPAGSTLIAEKSWVAGSYSPPNVGACCDTSLGKEGPNSPAIVPNSLISGNTTGGKLLIQATIPFSAAAGYYLNCQPNIDGVWAGASQALAYATFDFLHLWSTNGQLEVHISRIYPAPLKTGKHDFTLACGTGTNGGGIQLLPGGMVSYAVFELH
jgi:hypothetical protein